MSEQPQPSIAFRPVQQIHVSRKAGTTRTYRRVQKFLQAHGIDLNRVPADTTLTVGDTAEGQALRVFVWDEGSPICPRCEGCIAGSWVTVPLKGEIPDLGTPRGAWPAGWIRRWAA